MWQVRLRSAPAKEAAPMTREDFFDSLPTDSFTEDEEALRDALLTFLETWQEGEPPTLSNAGSDAAVRSNRVKVLPKGTPVSLKDWIDRRMGGEIEMQPDPGGQMRFGIRGELNMSGAGPAYEEGPFRRQGLGTETSTAAALRGAAPAR